MARGRELRIGYLPTFYHTAVLLQDRYPSDLGPVEWEFFPTGPAMMKAFADGRLDLGYIGLPPAMIGMQRGIPIRCVAGGHMDGTVLVGLSDLRAHDELGGDVVAVLDQFRGRAIGTPAEGSIHDVILRFLLRKAGLDGQVEVRNFPVADLITEELARGSLVGGAGTPALAVAGERFAGTRILIPPKRLWPNNPSYGILATADVTESRPEALDAFLRLHEAATAAIRTRPTEAAARTAHVVGVVEEDFVLATYRISPRYCAALPDEFLDATEAFIPAMRDLGYLARPMEIRDVFDRRFIRKVHPGPHHYDEGMA